MNSIPFYFCICLCLLVGTAASAEAKETAEPQTTAEPHSTAELRIRFPVEKFVLANGLTVLLVEDHTVPMIAYHTWYRVGSRNEKPGVTGAAHMLEHMMSKGAKKYSHKDFDRILHENGVVENAFTIWDYTGFYMKLPSSKLELIMDMEVDRMRFLALRPEDLKSELKVVGEERRWRVDNNPTSLLRETLMGTLFKAHPYHWPVIGYMKDIEAYTSDKLRQFYDTYYVPNNAVLVISGDINPKVAKSLVEKYYGVLTAKELPKSEIPAEPEAKAAQRFVTESDVQSSTVMLAYKGVNANDPDSYALDLASAVLGEGPSSRLYKRLVYQETRATATGGHNVSIKDPGYFMVVATLRPGQRTDASEKALREEVERLRSKLVTAKELQKVKSQVIKGVIDELVSIDGKARSLAVNEIVFGSYEKLFTDLEKYQQVTAQDIQRVANKYFQRSREVMGVLNPRKKGSSK
ncbi:MAG: insulinase family protein [Bdellovibrio sp.]|nr:MAG: insulinase family protein [Bdellovibrio sp.]